MKEIKRFGIRCICMLGLFWVIFGMIFGVTAMKNNAMYPKISAGDVLLFFRIEKTYRPQDVIVYKKDGRLQSGRIIAGAGDTIEVTETAELKINGNTVTESDIFYKTPRDGNHVDYPVTLKAGQYFVLGDDRECAKDSRYYGAISQAEIRGKVITVIRRSGL